MLRSPLENISLSSIDENPFNSRMSYRKDELRRLANSLQRNGLLSPVRLRRKGDRYQLVFGHRRVRAAQLAGWKSIPAEVVSVSDQHMLEFSLAENLERNDLSDLERGFCFWRLNKEFGMTYEEIGILSNLSRAHVCNYIRMTQLFSESTLSSDPNLLELAHKISEHHARLILQIKDEESRVKVLRMVVSENLSVRDLQRIMQRLPGFFQKNTFISTSDTDSSEGTRQISDTTQGARLRDREAIVNALLAEYNLPHERDFAGFANLHAFENGFSIYSSFPPLHRIEGSDALNKERNWFFKVAPHFEAKLKNVRIQFFGSVALATLYVDFQPKNYDKKSKMRVRGSVLFLNDQCSWKIVHEHWSKFEGDVSSVMNVIRRSM